MIQILTLILPVLLKLLGMFFNSKAASEEQRLAYKDFITKMQGSQDTSARLKSSYDAQLEKLKNSDQ